ncbi:hypothetical protein, partial [Amycolatopsis sp. SID8362]|uniref:hypothetical protein n=1 Tax=Amycolatopsis sp. SID8362 TaxID=2690346 RepID=UPI00136E67C5
MTGFGAWAATAVEVFGEIKPLAGRLPQDRFEVAVPDGDPHGDAAGRLLGSVAREVGLRQAVDVRRGGEQAASSFA